MRKTLAAFLLILGLLIALPAHAAPSANPFADPLPMLINPVLPPPPATHGANLSWTASTSASTCLSTSTPACTLTYNVFVGSTSGGESATAFNTAPITGTTYDFAITPTGSIQNFYFVVQAVETIGTVTLTSANSNEVSVSFPALPAAASGLSVSSVN